MSLSGAPAPVRLAALLGGRQLVRATVRAAAAGAVTGLVAAYTILMLFVLTAVTVRQVVRVALLGAVVTVLGYYVASR